METTISLLKKFIDLGYQKVITTPHIMSDYYHNTPEIINKGLDLVKEIDAQKLPIEIHAAAEYNLEPNFVSLLKEKNTSIGIHKTMYCLNYHFLKNHLI